MTAGLLGTRKKGNLLICILWLLIDTAFEMGQGLKPMSLTILPEWLEVHILPLAKYFKYGTFDIGDIVASLLGALAAFVVAEFIRDPFLQEWKSQRTARRAPIRGV
jgi:hypothetical protein